MTPEEQRIAIAEACGWKRLEICRERIFFHIQAKEYCIHHDGKPCDWLPDFCNDLNAMHEAEDTLTICKSGISDCQWQRYWSELDTGPAGCTGRKQLLHATAAQRAEAFLRTLNLWKD